MLQTAFLQLPKLFFLRSVLGHALSSLCHAKGTGVSSSESCSENAGRFFPPENLCIRFISPSPNSKMIIGLEIGEEIVGGGYTMILFILSWISHE